MMYRIEQLLERDDIKNTIIGSLVKTKGESVEHAFNFCTSHGDISITEIEEGKKHGIDLENKCPQSTVGAFHTHTKLTSNEDIVPSPRDILKSVEDDLAFFCVGGSNGDVGIVRCFDKNDLVLEINKVLEITKKDVTGKNISNAVRHVVGRMLADMDYLDNHSYKILYDLGGITWKK